MNCPKCGSDNIRVTAHFGFEKNVLYHRCDNDDCPEHVKEEFRYNWKGETYEHDKYPEANLDIWNSIICPRCNNHGVYVSKYYHFSDDMLTFRCIKCAECFSEKMPS